MNWNYQFLSFSKLFEPENRLFTIKIHFCIQMKTLFESQNRILAFSKFIKIQTISFFIKNTKEFKKINFNDVIFIIYEQSCRFIIKAWISNSNFTSVVWKMFSLRNTKIKLEFWEMRSQTSLRAPRMILSFVVWVQYHEISRNQENWIIKLFVKHSKTGNLIEIKITKPCLQNWVSFLDLKY